MNQGLYVPVKTKSFKGPKREFYADKIKEIKFLRGFGEEKEKIK